MGDVDWARRLVWVEPTDDPGTVRWSGSGVALSIEVCHAIRATLAAPSEVVERLTRRASARLAEIRAVHWWARPGETALVRDPTAERTRWWTFAGARANRSLAVGLAAAGIPVTSLDDLSVGLAGVVAQTKLPEVARSADPAACAPEVDPRRLDAVKFAACLPRAELVAMVQARDHDPTAVRRACAEPVAAVDA